MVRKALTCLQASIAKIEQTRDENVGSAIYKRLLLLLFHYCCLVWLEWWYTKLLLLLFNAQIQSDIRCSTAIKVRKRMQTQPFVNVEYCARTNDG